MGVDAAAYRRVMSRLATGVTVLTARHGQGHEVMTANAVMSVSLEPVLLLASVGRGCRWADAARAAGSFAINVLSAEQEELSRWCASARRHHDPAEIYRHPHRKVWSGALVFDHALAAVECTLVSEHAVGDHDLLIGQVTDLHVNDAGSPLLFFRGAYAGLGAQADDWSCEGLRVSC